MEGSSNSSGFSAEDTGGSSNIRHLLAGFVGQQPGDDRRPPAGSDRGELAAMASLLRRVRARRASGFPAEMFGEPAWDALLTLYARQQAGDGMTASDLAASTGAPISTALRWIDYLHAEGLVERDMRGGGAQAARVQLSDLGLTKLERFLGEMLDDVRRVGTSRSADLREL